MSMLSHTYPDDWEDHIDAMFDHADTLRKQAREEGPFPALRISNTSTGEYWSNECGWVERGQADVFQQADVSMLNLPIDGEWV